MLTLRLKRVGRRHDASFRVVAVDSRQGPKSGKQIETLGTYNPRSNERTLKADRISYWLSQGAQTSDTVRNLLISEGIIAGKKVNVLPKKSPIQKEEVEAAAQPAAAGEATEEAASADTEAAEEESGEAAGENGGGDAATDEQSQSNETTPEESADAAETPAEEPAAEAPAESADTDETDKKES